MMRHCAIEQMSAFDAAWAVLKAAPGDPLVERMRQYVLTNIQSPASIVRQSAENVHRYLTDLNSGRDPGPTPEMYDMHDVQDLNREAQGQGFPQDPWYSSVDSLYSSGQEEVPDDSFFAGVSDGPAAQQPSVRARGPPERTNDLSGLPMAAQEALRAAAANRPRPARGRMPSEAEERAMSDVDMMRDIHKSLTPMQHAFRHLANRHFA